MKKLLVIILLFLSGLNHLLAQERVYMPFFEIMNMHPDYQYSTSKLFKTYVDKNSKYLLVLPLRYDTLGVNESFDEAKQHASEQNCNYFIQGEFNRMGEIVIITISMYNTADGNKIWNTLSKALTPDDIDPILEKVAANLGNPNAESEGDIYNVTAYDSKELNKIGANKYMGLTIGGGYSFVSGLNKNFPAGIGFAGSYDMRNVIFNMKAEMYFSDIKIYYVNIEAMYPLSTRKNTGFLSGAMGYGGVNILNNDNNYWDSYHRETGLFLFAGGGYLMNRNSNVALKFSGNLYTPFFKVNTTVPVGILFTTTLLFGR